MRTSLISILLTTILAGCEDAQNLGSLDRSGNAGTAGQAGAGAASGGANTAGTTTAGTAGVSGNSGQAGQPGGAGSSGASGGAAGSGAAGSGQGGAQPLVDCCLDGTVQKACVGGGYTWKTCLDGSCAGTPGPASCPEDAGGNGGASGAGPGGAAGAGGAQVGGAGGYHARFIFQDGQESIGDFCVAYGKDGNGNLAWDKQKLLESNGLKASTFNGLQKLTRYLALQGKPEGFGFIYPGQGCEMAHGWSLGGDLPVSSGTHFTVVAMPYSGEPIYLRELVDPVEENQTSSAPGFRIANVVHYSEDITLSLTNVGGQKVALGTFPWASALPQEYISSADGHLYSMEVSTPSGSWEIDWTSLDLLPVVPRRTIFVGAQRALACTDLHEASAGLPDESSCFFVENKMITN